MMKAFMNLWKFSRYEKNKAFEHRSRISMFCDFIKQRSKDSREPNFLILNNRISSLVTRVSQSAPVLLIAGGSPTDISRYTTGELHLRQLFIPFPFILWRWLSISGWMKEQKIFIGEILWYLCSIWFEYRAYFYANKSRKKSITKTREEGNYAKLLLILLLNVEAWASHHDKNLHE